MIKSTTIALIISLPCLAGTAHASLSQATTASPGGFVQAGAYPSTFGAANRAGNDLQAGYGLGADFHEQSFAGGGVAAASANNTTPGSAGPLNQSISGNAGLGFVRFQGSNAYTDEANFANAILDGGWNESFTLNHPSLNGQNGFMVIRLHAQGGMNTFGLSGSTYIEVWPYKNAVSLPMNPYFAQEGSDVVPNAEQFARWGLASFGLPDSRTVNSFVTLSVPITFGTPFTLGIYVRAAASQRSRGGFNGPSGDSLNFSARGVEWSGITAIRNSAGSTVSGVVITSGSGINWLPPIQACDAVDFNNDGSSFDPTDVDAFFSAFSEGPCIPANATCNDIDFNNDGAFFDPCDVASFLLQFSEGPCTQCGQ